MLSRQWRSTIRAFRPLNSFRFGDTADEIPYDVCIVGGGPAGLSSAIRLKQIAQLHKRELTVCVLDKGSEIGSHTLSGNIFEPRYIAELFPNIDLKQKRPSPFVQPVMQDKFMVLPEKTGARHLEVPHFLLPNDLNNKGNYVMSLGQLCKWLAEEAAAIGVDVFTGFAADKLKMDVTGKHVCGVILKDFGIDKNGAHKPEFQAGAHIVSPITILAEGARGSLTQEACARFNLTQKCAQQTYALGIKELWEVQNAPIEPGTVMHTIGFPTFNEAYAGGFLYTSWDQKAGHQYLDGYLQTKPPAAYVHTGYVVGLDYTNPYLNPYEEFQQWKTSGVVCDILRHGRVLKYGARVLNEGGYHSIPKLTFPGGLLIGCSAGFLNVMKIKGAHNAMKSGIVAAESIMEGIKGKEIEYGQDLTTYETMMHESPVIKELRRTRNVHNAFTVNGKHSWMLGMLKAGVLAYAPESWNLFEPSAKDKAHSDTQKTLPASKCQKIHYPKHDGKLTFDILDSVSRSGVHHEHDQPSHLKIKPELSNSWRLSRDLYAGLERNLNRTFLSCKSL